MSNSVALISAVDPYPIDAGKKVVLAGFLEYFIDRLGPNNVHYLMVGGRARDDFPAKLHPQPKPSALGAFGSVVTRTGTGRASLQESLLHSADVRTAIHRTLDRVSPDLEVYDTVRMAQYASVNRSDQQICYLDDLFSERYRAMLVAADQYPDINIQPLGNFASHVPRPLRPLADHRRSQRLLLALEQRLVSRSEDKSAHRFRTNLLVNAHESDLLRQRSGVEAGRVQVIPPLIGHPIPRRDYHGAPEFLFLGQLLLPHNDDGLRSFLSNVWPLVLAARPDARLRIVGRHPRPELTELVAKYANSVTLEGFVSDLSEILGRSAAMINPLRFGSGIKLKIIEALGAGVPVISTTIGADGVAIGLDEGVLVADSDAELSELLLESTDVVHNVRLSTAAREHFARCYSRDVVFARYDAAFG
ncbi:glycosyltransferase family 4 protein [Rhodococcus sp. MS16]|uniref:glycosyltransferase n=1 Tax=Rhodococcus sp. MS16 TaxID=2579941 RepID=UPI0031FED30D